MTQPNAVAHVTAPNRLRLLVPLAILAALTVATSNALSSQPRTLAQEARWVLAHGGSTGTCWGCATPRMKRLSHRLIVRRFQPAGRYAVRLALCYSWHESGHNPHAKNPRSTSIGLFQEQPQWHGDGLLEPLDPVFAVNAAWRISKHGRDWTAWRNPAYSCP